MTPEPLLIALTFDAEADSFDANLPAVELAEQLQWRGITEGAPLIDEVLDRHHDSSGNRARATWFVRCDDQIGAMTGDCATLLKRFRSCWLRHLEAGNEIGFHPHLYRETDRGWSQDLDETTLGEQVLRAHAAMRDAGFDGRVSRIGEAYCSNAIMLALDGLGIAADSTAMPGRIRIDGTRHIDWSGTPETPYHPSAADYRVPGRSNRSLLEIPMTLVPTRAAYDTQPLRRYVDLSFHHGALRAGVQSVIRDIPLLVTVTHPSAVLPGLAGAGHGLLSFSIAAFEANLRFILEKCERIGRPSLFVTLSECAARLRA